MEYRTYKPTSNLKHLIKCFWSLEGPSEETPYRQRIVPDGCMEMIFHCGDLYKQYLNNERAIIQPRSFVFGQITQPLEIEPTGITSIFAVRFYPEGFLPFATLQLTSLQNRAVSLSKFYGNVGVKLENDIIRASSIFERIRISESFLEDQLSNQEVLDKIIKESIKIIFDLKGQISVSDLSKETNAHRRKLERRFSSIIGISPKQLAKIVRLQSTIRMLLNKQFSSLTALAHEGNYYDQAHFIKDFKEFTGQSPKRFFADNLKMSSLFYGID